MKAFKIGIHKKIVTTTTRLALGLFALYNLFPQLTVGLRCCVYYWQCLTVVTDCMWLIQPLWMSRAAKKRSKES